MSETVQYWYVSRNGQQHGPMTRSQIDVLNKNGQLLPDDYLWAEELGDWKLAKDVFGSMQTRPRPPAAPPSAPSSDDIPAPTRVRERDHILKNITDVLLNPRGRLRRMQFWLALFGMLIFGYGLNKIAGELGSAVDFVLWLYLSVTIYGKRLHDLGRSAWMLAWPYGLSAICLVGAGAMVALSNPYSTNVMVIVGFAIAGPVLVWMLTTLIVGIPRGRPGDNRFGPDPLETLVIATSPGR